MTRLTDRVASDGTRAWFDRASHAGGNPLTIDGYGCVGEAGGERLQAAMVADIRDKLAISRDSRLLEVGCGAGAITHGLAVEAGRTIAADFAVGMVAEARRRRTTGVEFVAADATCLPFQACAFDRVLCYSVFNNFPSGTYAARVVAELIRVTRPGGILLIGQVPNAHRKDEWYRAYADRFGAPRRSALRDIAGAAKQRGRRFVRGALSLLGVPQTASLDVHYYKPSFFRALLAGTPHRCDVLPALDLLDASGARRHNDYRLDVRISCGRALE
ncbi:MAG TPA: methyltransferase domain-containing protein [Vicinamibacterales bacterium]|nr:methyltransferase domain-containing protein [Vicinamibacterales bacterium]